MRILLLVLGLTLLLPSCSDETQPAPEAAQEPASVDIQEGPGTLGNPILDSAMPEREAMGIIGSSLPPDCPQDTLARLATVSVRYHGFDDKVHQGQIIVDRDLAGDVVQVFAFMLEIGFPLHSVLPVAHPDIQAKAPYGLSPDTDNSSGFAYRPQAGGATPSMHARGWAVDLNPRENPYIKDGTMLPPRSSYDPGAVGTFTPDHPVVLKFKELGWEWGGDWTSLKDYMHFEKVPAGMAKS